MTQVNIKYLIKVKKGHLIEENEMLQVYKCKYPMAKYHFLIVPRERIRGLANFDKKHVKLIERMTTDGFKVMSEHGNHDRNNVLMGFHSIASDYVVMHVISLDMDSEHLQSPEMFNSFHTPFFRTTDKLTLELEDKGRIKVMKEAKARDYLFQEMQCHICRKGEFTDVEIMKKHLNTHYAKEETDPED